MRYICRCLPFQYDSLSRAIPACRTIFSWCSVQGPSNGCVGFCTTCASARTQCIDSHHSASAPPPQAWRQEPGASTCSGGLKKKTSIPSSLQHAHLQGTADSCWMGQYFGAHGGAHAAATAGILQHRSHATSWTKASSSTQSWGRCYATEARTTDHLLDMRHPASWYPLARQMRRKIIAHLGPTNSGKTHMALEALKTASSGVYCGPLRLLACEVLERLSAGGLPCRLVTGQEVRGQAGARHVACTVEMASLTEQVQVAVLDEIQMISDLGRGWGWTRALLGLPAHTLHVCGAPEVLPLLQQLVHECGDTLEVCRFRRLSRLVVSNQALGSVGALQPGDCLVAFSRREIHGLKREVLRRTRHQCALVYGALPPSTRRQQAALFNGVSGTEEEEGAGEAEVDVTDLGTGSRGSGATWDDSPESNVAGGTSGDNCSGGDCRSSSSTNSNNSSGGDCGSSSSSSGGYSSSSTINNSSSEGASSSSSSSNGPGRPQGVLVASDAIGMGLNLNIRRVIFTSMHKYDGRSIRRLRPSEVKQIAGRAGRFSSAHPTGYVTCLHPHDLPLLHEALATSAVPLEAACLMPRSEDITSFALHHSELRYDDLLERFAELAKLSENYRLGDFHNVIMLGSMLQHLSASLTPEELYTFCVSPADPKDAVVSAALLRMVSAYAKDGSVPGELAVALHKVCLPENRAMSLSLRHLGKFPPEAVPLSFPGPEVVLHVLPVVQDELKSLEALHRVCDLYVWLSYRFPQQFKDRELVEEAEA